MKVLVTDYGSSSLKYQLIGIENESVLAKGLCERIGIEDSKLVHEAEGKDKHVVENPMPNHFAVIKMVTDMLISPVYSVIKDAGEVSAVGHHVLHAGTVYSGSIIVNDDIERIVRKHFDLGSLHNPASLMGIETCEGTMSGTSNVVVSDTAFGMSVSEKAYLCVIPHKYFEKYNIRRYGSHGTSHKFVSGEAIKFSNLDPEKAKVIICHLGNDASVSASIGGRCMDTSMGLTPLEGLTMGTRSGDIDPTVVQPICNKEGRTVNEVLDILNEKFSVLGMGGGISSDFRGIENVKTESNHLTAVALDTFQHRMTEYIGAYATAMNGVDAIVFTVGAGENDKPGRRAICESLSYLGVRVDDEVNNARNQKRIISALDSKMKVMLIPTNEELVIARETLTLVK